MIGGRGQPGIVQCLGQRLGLGAGAAIDDARLPAPGGGEIQNLAARPILGLKGQMDVRAVEPAQKALRLCPGKKPGDDFLARFGIGGGGKRRQRHIQCPAQFPDAQVIGTEIMAPLADAMRLVDGDATHAGTAQHRHRRPRSQPLGRHV